MDDDLEQKNILQSTQGPDFESTRTFTNTLAEDGYKIGLISRHVYQRYNVT